MAKIYPNRSSNNSDKGLHTVILILIRLQDRIGNFCELKDYCIHVVNQFLLHHTRVISSIKEMQNLNHFNLCTSHIMNLLYTLHIIQLAQHF